MNLHLCTIRREQLLSRWGFFMTMSCVSFKTRVFFMFICMVKCTDARSNTQGTRNESSSRQSVRDLFDHQQLGSGTCACHSYRERRTPTTSHFKPALRLRVLTGSNGCNSMGNGPNDLSSCFNGYYQSEAQNVRGISGNCPSSWYVYFALCSVTGSFRLASC